MIFIVMVSLALLVIGASSLLYDLTHKGNGLQDVPEKIPMPKRNSKRWHLSVIFSYLDTYDIM